MLQLLGRANSSNVMKVIWALEELGIPYDRRDIGGQFGGTDSPEYIAMNPNQVVPTIIDDGFVLWESNAIVRYLAAKHAPGTSLWPADLQAKADIDRWMDWQHTVLGAPMTVVFWGLVRTAPDKRDMPAIHAAAAKLGRIYGMLEPRLQQHDYICGDALTPADIAIGVHAHRWFSFQGVDKAEHEAVRAWYDRLLARPAFKQHVAAPMT